ncbi:MAG: cyclic 2,3-diphosphoglycerate synthase [Coriobacteriia bacterium]
MSRVVALIDGEHYPPVVRFALDELSREYDVVAAVFLGGTEKVDLEAGEAAYGLPVVWGRDAASALREAIERYGPDEVVDLSDEPVVSSEDRLVLASLAVGLGVGYRGADFTFTAELFQATPKTPAMRIIGTGKRVGKTSISAYAARLLKADGVDLVVLAMGRGGPVEPELIRGDEVELTTEDLLALAAQGKHASSDNYEDAVMSRVTTVGCRRCGGGLAGKTFFSNVAEGVDLADSLGKELLILEGSGAAMPPAGADSTLLIVGAAQGERYVREYFGPFRVALADAVLIAAAEEPNATAEEVDAIRAAIAEVSPEGDTPPVVATTFRPQPLADISGRRVFFATTAPAAVLPSLVGHLEEDHGAHVVASSPHLSDRARLRQDIREAAGDFDVMLTELKAAAIDVAAAAAEEAGVETVLCDNAPVPVDGGDLDAVIRDVARCAIERAEERE